MKRQVSTFSTISILIALTVLSACTGQVSLPSLPTNRLDANVYPTSQSLELFTDPASPTYSGKVSINLVVKRSTSTFRFHAQEMELSTISLTQNGDIISLTTETGPENLIIARTQSKLEPGEYLLDIFFNKAYNQQTVGLYQVEYEDEHYLFTQLEAVDARKAFPCWDEPQYKIPWQLTLNIPREHHAITNTPVESESTDGTGRRIIFKQTKPLPSYLIAIAVGPFDRIPFEGLSVPGHIYTTRGKGHLASRAAQTTAPILAALEHYFDIPYPYEKLDFIAVPEFWPGGMENAGAITYADRILLLDEQRISLSQKRRLATVIAHEIAHQWFGDYVTMHWWDDLWLNESFADWMDHKILDQLYPEYRNDLNEMSRLQYLMNLDAKTTTRPIYREVIYSAQIFEDLGLAYGKGTQVLNMVEQWIGPEKFRQGVLAYLNANAWGNAQSADLWAELSKVSGQDVYSVLSSFITQSSLPLLQFELLDQQTLKVTQERYVNIGVSAPPLQWTLPVDFSYKTKSGVHQRTVFLDQTELEIQLDEPIEWILPNTEARGYYRWTLPVDMFRSISKAPAFYLNPLERISFLGNADALVKAGILDGGHYLELLKAFGTNSEPEDLESALDNLGYISGLVSSGAQSEQFAGYIHSFLQPALNKIGLQAQNGEAETIAPLRSRLIGWLANQGQDEGIRQFADSLATEYLKNPDSIHYSLIRTVLNISARQGDTILFDEYQRRFENARSSRERRNFLSALGQFRDEELQNRALTYSLEGSLRTNELRSIVSGIRGTEAGKEKAFVWVMQNYATLVSRMPEMQAVTILGYGADGSLERIKTAREFMAGSDNIIPGTADYLAKVEEGILNREQLDALILPAVNLYLEKGEF